MGFLCHIVLEICSAPILKDQVRGQGHSEPNIVRYNHQLQNASNTKFAVIC